jgi:aminoglycoside 3-N-acetyltransferase
MTPLTQAQIVADLRALGVAPGMALMLHSAVRSVGPVMGGPNTIISALLDALGPAGTLMMYVGWHEIPDFIPELPAEQQPAYLEAYPAFDPATARAKRDHGVLAEFLRTWPGAARSLNPEASMVAVGARATELTADHPLDYGYGAGSPLAKLVEWGGSVLLLGAPLNALTLLHYAENRARMRHKNVIRYPCPLLRDDGTRVWVEVEDYDTGEPHADYGLGQIARAYLAAREARQARVGAAACYLFDAADLAGFAIDWLEARYGG